MSLSVYQYFDLQAGIAVTSAVTILLIPKLAKAPLIKPHGSANN